MNIATRKPTGTPNWPTYLIEGPAATGRAATAAELTAVDTTGRAFWIDWGKEDADALGALPGVDYDIVEHDGTFRAVKNAIEDIAVFAADEEAAGNAPVVLVINGISTEWKKLRDHATDVVATSPTGRRVISEDPGADLTTPRHVWRDIDNWHEQFMTPIRGFRGVVVLIADGNDVDVQHGGFPTGAVSRRIDGHRALRDEADVVISTSTTRPAQITSIRSPHVDYRPGRDEPWELGDMSLEQITFDVLFQHATPDMFEQQETPHADDVDTDAPAAAEDENEALEALDEPNTPQDVVYGDTAAPDEHVDEVDDAAAEEGSEQWYRTELKKLRDELPTANFLVDAQGILEKLEVLGGAAKATLGEHELTNEFRAAWFIADDRVTQLGGESKSNAA